MSEVTKDIEELAKRYDRINRDSIRQDLALAIQVGTSAFDKIGNGEIDKL